MCIRICDISFVVCDLFVCNCAVSFLAFDTENSFIVASFASDLLTLNY